MKLEASGTNGAAPCAAAEESSDPAVPPSFTASPPGPDLRAGGAVDGGEDSLAFLRAFVPRRILEGAAAARSRAGRLRFYAGVPDAEWYDWRWQFRNRITSLEELWTKLPFPTSEWEARRTVLRDFRMGITPYYLSLVDPDATDDPVARQVVPLVEEFEHRAVGDEDPLGEEVFSPVPGITHRYPDRALMVVTNSCAIYCRYCTRKRIMYEDAVPEMQLSAMIDYIAGTPSIRDVIVSGGDPLTFATEKLDNILGRLRAIPHVEIIRIGSRVPLALPMRITDELCRMLERHHPLWINVHFNHAAEITPDAARACDRLIRAGIPLNNQAVLLRGVNDSVETQRDLVHALMSIRVRPYYLYNCDSVRGSEHMRTSVARGLEIMEGLRGHTSGLAIPQFVVDAPGGGGKVPVSPQYVLAYDNGKAVLRNFQGRLFEIYDPVRTGESPRFLPAARIENVLRPETVIRHGYVRPAAPGNGHGVETAAAMESENGDRSHGNGRGSHAGSERTARGATLGGGRGSRTPRSGRTADDAAGKPVVGKSTWARRGRRL